MLIEAILLPIGFIALLIWARRLRRASEQLRLRLAEIEQATIWHETELCERDDAIRALVERIKQMCIERYELEREINSLRLRSENYQYEAEDGEVKVN